MNPMYHLLEKELATFESRTPGSRAALKRAEPRMPLGVASNFRSYEPWPLFVKDAKGSHIHDLDGNEYIDFNLCFGALMAGHCHPAVVAAVQERLVTGTMYGMPHTLEYDLADEICQRFPVEQVRFGSSGTEVTMHAIRIARGFTGRDKIIKMEGAYHGVHDSVLVSMKPKLELVRRSRSAQPGTGLGWSARRHGEEHAGGAVQRSQGGRRPFARRTPARLPPSSWSPS
jgi:glutamate-1-semialdehyde 2,1-aminomutase